MTNDLCRKCGGERTLYSSGRKRCNSCRLQKYKENILYYRQWDRERHFKNKEKRNLQKKQNRLRHMDSAHAKERVRYQNKKDFHRCQERTPKRRHKTLLCFLRKEGIQSSDLLWSFNFYSHLIADVSCHYCLGLLNQTGAGLDRVENNTGHTCYNVVPCCRKCNRIKGNDTSYEEMMLLAPVLREIVRRKSFASV
jgi:hypothetical protein